jgi:Flp pilus assembly pilin Flp
MGPYGSDECFIVAVLIIAMVVLFVTLVLEFWSDRG